MKDLLETHPRVLMESALVERLAGCQANASSRDQRDRDGADARNADDGAAWREAMLDLNRCCPAHHLRYLANRAGAPAGRGVRGRRPSAPVPPGRPRRHGDAP